ncbi:uncharacterized protein LOC113563501 [Ooceraea biroi]|uniref:uncharacterized protein LOC113563501 n=1 Tax=Ooceraea biroi TaxID=2015173 RepID=UPI000F08A71F|nr:uncharacterized protein LOC113563501 [Ooceraea biroi]
MVTPNELLAIFIKLNNCNIVHRTMKPLSGIMLFVLIPTTYGLIGFDCGGQHLNVTTVSLLGVRDCELKHQSLITSDTHIQLLQLAEYNYVEVIQCKVEISRVIQYCGMHSHISAVANARLEYLQEVSRVKCYHAFQEGTFSIGLGGIVTKLKPNTTTVHSILLAGTINHDGTCKGTQFSDPYGTWHNVVVDGTVRISLKSSYVPVHLNSGKVMLRSGTVCTLSDGFCIDFDDGYSYWKPMPTSSCNFHQYNVLYEGTAVKMNGIMDTIHQTIYTLVSQDTTFALTAGGSQAVCGYTLLTTEHPKLFILEAEKGNTFAERRDIPVENLDIFTYVNSKFVYVEKHIRHQMTSLYRDVIQQRCELEKEVLKNTLSFATLQPDEFAYRLMKGPGYMAVTAGEAVHVIKCIPVDVIVRRTKECYIELPVTVRNTSLFITPKSHVLTKMGTIRECSYELPTLYRIEDTWIELIPEPRVRRTSLQQLQPMTSMSWNYLTPGPLASSGIYSQADLDKIRDHIMFPAEKPALLNSMARGITGHVMPDDTMSIYNLLDEASLNKIAESTAKRIWGGFITFGSATAGVFGVLLVVRLIKLAIDTMIHGYALHSAYGCSLYVLGAIWSSLTHLLLYLARGTAKRSHTDGRADPKEQRSSEPVETVLSQSLSQNNPSNQPTSPQVTDSETIVYTDLQKRLREY